MNPTLTLITALLVAFLPPLVASAQPADVVLGAGVTILIDPNEPAPVQRAVGDLIRDYEKVTGYRPIIAHRIEQLPHATAPLIVVSCDRATTADWRRKDIASREAHAVFIRTLSGQQGIVLQGADLRGTIFAIYTFSDRVLGVPPLWYWGSWQPQRKTSISVPGDLSLRFESPHVQWRAWFPNDQDLWSSWKRSAETKQGILCETMLRLKLNVLDVGSIRDFPKPAAGLLMARAATAYGLAVTGTHTSPLAASLNGWEDYWRMVRKQKPPAMTLANADKFEEFWEHHIRLGLREKLEMIWMIGLRGAGDEGFFKTFTDAPADEAGRAKAIEAIMRRQVALLKRVTSQERPLMRTVLYNENSDYFAAGLLHPPDEQSLIWNFCSTRRDHYPAADVLNCNPAPDRPIGYYLNLQFTSSGSHLVQGEGPWKMEANYRMVQAISTRPLEFSVVNTGNLREFVLEASANAAMLWDFASYDTDRFLQEFSRRYFGDESGPQVAALYRRFYDSYWCQRKPTLPGFARQFIFQDMRLARASEQLLKQLPDGFDPNPLEDGALDISGRYFNIVPEDCGTTNQIEAMLQGTSESISKLDAVIAAAEELLPQLSEPRRTFFNDNLRVQARFLREANRTLNALAKAMLARRDADSAEVLGLLTVSEASAHAMRETLREAEHDPFKAWFDGDRLFGITKLADRIALVKRRVAK